MKWETQERSNGERGPGCPEMQEPGAARPLTSSHRRPSGTHTRTSQDLASKGGSRGLGVRPLLGRPPGTKHRPMIPRFNKQNETGMPQTRVSLGGSLLGGPEGDRLSQSEVARASTGCLQVLRASCHWTGQVFGSILRRVLIGNI